MKDLNKLGVEELQILECTETTGGCSFAYDVGFALRLLFVGNGGANVPLELAAYAQHC